MDQVQDVKYAVDLPRYDARGHLHVDHLFTAFACYACGRAFGSYTRGAAAPATWLPERVRAYERPPALVSAYLADHRDVTISGWSELTGAGARALEQALAGR